jgi:hypothetical protein
VYEGPEATASAVPGSTVAVSNWSIYTLPPRNLEAVLAYEPAHRLALSRLVSLFIYWLSGQVSWSSSAAGPRGC